MAISLASFPNSRIKPRTATTAEIPTKVLVKQAGTGLGPNGTTLIATANLNRTFLTIENADPDAIVTETFDANKNIAYGFDPVTLASGANRFALKHLQAIDDESLDNVYAIALGTVDVPINILEGEG